MHSYAKDLICLALQVACAFSADSIANPPPRKAAPRSDPRDPMQTNLTWNYSNNEHAIRASTHDGLMNLYFSSSSPKGRQVLTWRHAMEIFLHKQRNASLPHGHRVFPLMLGKMYGVCGKTIRDIWRGKTVSSFLVTLSFAPSW